MFSEKVPFDTERSEFVMRKKVVFDDARPSPMPEKAPKELCEMIASSWAKDPEARPSSSDLLEKLKMLRENIKAKQISGYI